MRVAYVLGFDFSLAHGLLDRMRERLEVLTALGVEVELFVAVPKGADQVWARDFPCPVNLVHGVHSATASWRLGEIISEGNFDACYLRYGLPYPGLIRLVRSIPTVLEIHADDLAEARHRAPRYGLLVRSLRTRLLARAAGAIFVDPDLVRSPSFGMVSGPRGVISNGIRLRDDLRYGTTRDRAEGPPRLLLAAGAAEPWQGIDKYLQLAEACPALEFHLAGPTPGVVVPENMVLHGRLAPNHFERLLAQVDIGVGNLALERISRPRPSPLKVREYVRAGLPCILAHDDPDLAADATVLVLDYGFAVSPTIAKRVSSFAEAIVGSAISERNAHAVSLEAKERDRVLLLTQVLEGQERR